MTILEQMLANYPLDTIQDKKNAMKEVIQEVTLAGLSKTDFFKKAAFYGGTALRIFYGVRRFSEDLDFSLLSPDDSFSLETYFPTIRHAVESMGLNLAITQKEKTHETAIQSAFLKGNTREQFLVFYPGSTDFYGLYPTEKIKIKLEIDVHPPVGATTEWKSRLTPFPYQIRVYDKPSLFAGKIHAVMARGWKNRVKGRDLYDYLFYLATQTPLNGKHLEARLKQTHHLQSDAVLTRPRLLDLLRQRFTQMDFTAAKKDVIPFLPPDESLDMWGPTFFVDVSEQLQFQSTP